MEHKLCLICGSERLHDLDKFAKDYLCQCSSCGFVFCRLIPTNEELTKHYEGYGRNDYLSPLTIKRYKELLDSFEPYRETNNILDVGCGIGYFLEVAKQRGWSVYGTEYTDVAIDLCEEKGIKMHKGILNPENYGSLKFDVITSFEVIEHIYNPLDELNNMYKLLRKGGVFYFTTPNFNALERYFLGAAYSNICYPEHLSYYTKKTAHFLLNSIGFQRKYILTSGISLTAIRNYFFARKEKSISSTSTDDKVRTLLEEGRTMNFIKVFLNSILNLTGLGNSLKGFYLKK
ncbi:MAG: class I SAM-dependent methyltransferase [Chitinophagales bacterium]|jgi:2-polyprenyl-3-methyl-5-hydroxy-6-metoxy-1,4-benzoquinol methylase|nr:class I SAM-dependent methyltransferase [Sphingobacteriales bacterium]